MVLTTYVFNLLSAEGCALPWFTGHETRGAFLSLVEESSPQLAKALHEGEVTSEGRVKAFMSLKAFRPKTNFKVIAPQGSGRIPGLKEFVLPVDRNLLLSPEAEGWFSVTVMKDEVSKDMMLVAANVMGKEVSVKGCKFRVIQSSVEVKDPDTLIASPKDPGKYLDIYFRSPTYFNPLLGSKTYKVLYPDLHLLMGSLVSTAHYLTGKSLPKPEELASVVTVSGIDIRTPKAEVKEPTPTGFVGWVRLRFVGASTEYRRLIHGLLKLGEVVNVGGNRASGYGEISVISEGSKQGSPR